MKDFCRHCGKELEGNEPVCPACGMPTGTQPTYYQPPRSNNGTAIAIIVIALIVGLGILGIAFLPSLIIDGDTYTVTVTVEEVSITDDSHYFDSYVDAKLEFQYGGTSADFDKWIHLPTDGTKVTVPHNTAKFKVRGNPDDIKCIAYLVIETHTSTGVIQDYVDLYDVTSEITSGSPGYLGCSGVTFTVDSYDGSPMELKGDSNPVGYVKLTFKAVKNQ